MTLLCILASFPGRKRNGLATSASSNCIRMLCHGNCNISLQQTSARDTYNFSSCENRAFLLVEATVCCSLYYWSEIKVVRTKIVAQSAYTSAIEWSIEMEWAWLRRFNALRNWVLLLSCDCVLKFDWYCRLSGSESNSLNSRKLPGCFSYRLGTRLYVSRLWLMSSEFTIYRTIY